MRTLKGQQSDLSSLVFKTDDGLGFSFLAETTSKLLLFATNGRFYTLDASKMPGGRGHGEPIRLFIDLEQDADIVSLFTNTGGRKFLVASRDGQGFVVNEDDCVGNTRKGKQVLNVSPPNEARARYHSGRRHRCRHRREPQDVGLRPRPGAGNGARPRRALAALQGRRT